MQLSKRSMFYRSAKFQAGFPTGNIYFWDDEPNDLCAFMRSYLFNFFFKTAFTTLIGILVISAVLFAYFACTSNFVMLDLNEYKGWTNSILQLGQIVWCIILLLTLLFSTIGTIFGIGWLVRKLFRKHRQYDENGDPIPGVLETYIHSKRNKYCARLEIVE